MLKSVWLLKYIVSSLNDASSVLASYYRHLCDLIGTTDANMILNEPDGSNSTYLLITQRSACLLPVPPAIEGIDDLTENHPDKLFLRDQKLYAPLRFENVSVFGYLIFDHVKTDTVNEELRDALTAFSTVLYSESMGSIVRSFHNTAMRVENVCVDYKNGKMINHVVKNVSLDICENEFTIISGASGSGKSSLLNVMGCMLTPSSGAVYWHDTKISGMTEKERTAYRGKSVGFVFQRYNLISDLTAAENIGIAASLVKDPIPTKDVLEMVGLSEKARSYPTQLSGGEQQRVCIARALVKRANILLCDEPTGALDTENAAQIIRILKNITKNQGIPVVVITHNPSLLVLADHCITISNGTIVEDRFQPFALPAEGFKLR